MSRGPEHEARASFRDPDGVLFATGDRVVRRVRADADAALHAFLTSNFAGELVGAGRLIATRGLDRPPQSLARMPAGEDDAAWYEHDRIPFPSYACEWSPRMLHAAAAQTLSLAVDALPHGFGLKDATPDNILFRGPTPVFVDVLSFERRDPHDFTWLPYAQFVRTFLLPLLVNREIGLPIRDLLQARRDGLDPGEVYRWCSWAQRLRAPFRSLVSLPTWLSRRAERTADLYRRRQDANAEKARYILGATLRQLGRTLRAVEPRTEPSVWSGYDTQHDQQYVDDKTAAVASMLSRWPRTSVLDIGCNTGRFSLLAARAGAKVVAIDADPAVVDVVWTRARDEALDVQPLVANLAQPSPASGWMLGERPSLLERLSKRFDGVLMLAVVHHLLASERIPLDQVVDFAATLTTDLAIVEFVAPADPLFQRLSRGRDELYRHLTREQFEQAVDRRFGVLERVTLAEDRRWLYAMRLKEANAR